MALRIHNLMCLHGGPKGNEKSFEVLKGAVCFSGLLRYTLHSQQFLSEKIQILGGTSQYGVLSMEKKIFDFWPKMAIFGHFLAIFWP